MKEQCKKCDGSGKIEFPFTTCPSRHPTCDELSECPQECYVEHCTDICPVCNGQGKWKLVEYPPLRDILNDHIKNHNERFFTVHAVHETIGRMRNRFMNKDYFVELRLKDKPEPMTYESRVAGAYVNALENSKSNKYVITSVVYEESEVICNTSKRYELLQDKHLTKDAIKEDTSSLDFFIEALEVADGLTPVRIIVENERYGIVWVTFDNHRHMYFILAKERKLKN